MAMMAIAIKTSSKVKPETASRLPVAGCFSLYAVSLYIIAHYEGVQTEKAEKIIFPTQITNLARRTSIFKACVFFKKLNIGQKGFY